MCLNRKRMAVLLIYMLALACLFSHLPMVKKLSCGCQFRYEGWFWNEGPYLYALRPDGTAHLTWDIDWQRLLPRLLVATLAALLAFIWIGDEKSGWREGIEKVANRFTLASYALGVCSILFALIWLIPSFSDTSQINQGPQQGYSLFSRHPHHWVRFGLHYATRLLSVSVATSLASMIVYFRLEKLKILILCLLSLALTLLIDFFTFYNGDLPLKI